MTGIVEVTGVILCLLSFILDVAVIMQTVCMICFRQASEPSLFVDLEFLIAE